MNAPVLVASDLLESAQQVTNQSDWGDPSFPDRLHIAVDLIKAVGMGAAGEQAAAADNSLVAHRPSPVLR